MNRFLTFPLVAMLVVFTAVLYSSHSTGEPAENGLASVNSRYDHAESPELMTDEQIRTLLLDQWPISEVRIMSRSMALPTLTADIGFAQLGSTNSRSAFGTFWVRGTPKVAMKEGSDAAMAPSNHFAVHVDRVTGQAHIYADGWKLYRLWRDENLPKYKEATGWKE